MTDSDLALLERWGNRYLKSSSEAAATADDPIHVLNPGERAALFAVTRGAVLRAAFAGVLNAVVTGLGQRYADRVLPTVVAANATLLEHVYYWSLFGGLAILAAIAEIGYLYWDALRSVRRLSLVAGLALYHEENREVAQALARAALELPNPHSPVFGVDPHRESSRLKLLFAPLVYKAKISVTNFLFKSLVQRALGRFATRALLAFTAIPINAAWNALVCWFVLREARIRVMGPSAATELCALAFDVPLVSEAGRLAAHRAIGSAVVRTSEFHPNHIVLIRALRRRIGEPPDGALLDDSRAFLGSLAGLSQPERSVVLRLLGAAAIVDGRLVQNERRLLEEAFEAADVRPNLDHVERLRRAFVDGTPILEEDVRAIA